MHESENELLKNEISRLNKIIDLLSPSIETQAIKFGLKLEEPNRERGSYVGMVFGIDRLRFLLKYREAGAVAIANAELPEITQSLGMGDTMRIKYINGVISCASYIKSRKHKDNFN
ncbi:hypothetical protein RGU75_02340 [Glaciimonas sp. CA11.2]|uniref:hypothetical protein n=1 Tax=Glaciimonas sp. CA11.2 TaxID=3048601 RepID=UPI002AB4C43C|nr:hypothetical protein [Glaciimonas sp. CA11.2]MDY7545072.1 hypothetical protein [Glaciimonas sp. CA11.2]